MNQVLLKCEKISKSFGPTRALVDVDLEVYRGQVLGLIGENGSGKSTLTSIIVGAQKQDSGEMFIGGEPYSPHSMLDGQRRGVAMIVQEMGTLSGNTVSSNIFVGNLSKFSRFGLLDTKRINREAAEILTFIGEKEIQAQMMVDSLNFEDRKIVEIARAMYLTPDILIVDESTTALAQKGRRIIYDLIERMRQEDKAVIFISHDLDELMEVCTNIVVLRDGHRVGQLDKQEMSVAAMRRMMIGRELSENYFRGDYDGSFSTTAALEGRQLTSEDGMIENLDITLYQGEILGIGGLANSGMHELGKILCGISKPVTGQVVHSATGNVIKNPGDAVRHKIGYISKDRDLESLILNASIMDNIALPSLRNVSKGIFISGKKERALAKTQIDSLRIKCVDEDQFCAQLSGGNKQKVALGKWLANDCDIFIMDCPTRGIDIGVKATMYQIMYELKKQGKAIVMISEELLELIGMSDHILVMKDGSVTAELDRSESLSEAQVIEYMI